MLDASECPPTFNTPPWQVVGLIAGGPGALTRAVEGNEDDPQAAVRDLAAIGLSRTDVVVGIATSGRTPCVLAGLRHANQTGAETIGLSCTEDSPLSQVARRMIVPVVGPEVISGSTRLKAGTATKMVLNMLTTGAMVRLGKTYGHLMVDLQATNQKPAARSRRIVSRLAGVSAEDAERLLDDSGGDTKTAIVIHRRQVSAADARRLLDVCGGQLRAALEFTGSLPAEPSDIAGGGEDPAISLLLGLDGGGTKTVACLARTDAPAGRWAGRGEAGPANPQTVGWPVAWANLDAAIAQAFAMAGVP